MKHIPGVDAEAAIRLLMRQHKIDRDKALLIYLQQRRDRADSLRAPTGALFVSNLVVELLTEPEQRVGVDVVARFSPGFEPVLMLKDWSAA